MVQPVSPQPRVEAVDATGALGEPSCAASSHRIVLVK